MKPDCICVAEAFVAAINRHSVAEIAELMSEDHTFVDSQGRAVVGREAMTSGWAAYLTMFPDFEITIAHLGRGLARQPRAATWRD